jgi:hypothetical protein
MAYLFPNTPPTILPPEVLQVFRFLKTLPEDWVVWHHLAPWQKDTPDFLILNAHRQAVLVKVSNSSAGDVRPAAQMLLLADDRASLGEAEGRLLLDYVRALHKAASLQNVVISLAIVFPNIPEVQLEAGRLAKADSDPAWLGREHLQPEGVTAWLALFTGSILGEAAIQALRVRFTPEVVVPPTLTVRTRTQRHLQAGLTDFLLDYNQEAACKADLDLGTEGASLAGDFRLNIATGVAGSGKTLILLYRLRLLQVLYPEKRFLVLTHNRALIRDMQSRYHRLTGGLPETITWSTFMGWCHSQWPSDPAWTKPVGESRRAQLLRRAWSEFFQGTSITLSMLRSEIDWYKDQSPAQTAGYLQLERRGRGFRLMPEQRQRMTQAIAYYQHLLEQTGGMDWGDVPRKLWGFLQDGRLQMPDYDAVLVDEAQFFAPLWFEIIRELVRPQSGHLFVAADPTQGFLGRGASWKSIGLEARGRTHRLERSYRTTREILNFATLFYRQRVSETGTEDDILALDLSDLPGGAIPQLIPLGSPQDEITCIANEIAEFAKQGLPLGHLLVLHANWQGVQALIAAINRKLGAKKAFDPKDQYPGDYVRVTTLQAGTGLEAPIVFLAGFHQLFEEEQSLRLSDEEREALIVENTRKVYMAATRAGQRLAFTYVGDVPLVIKGLVGGK